MNKMMCSSAVGDALLALISAHYVLGTHSHKSREIVFFGGEGVRLGKLASGSLWEPSL